MRPIAILFALVAVSMAPDFAHANACSQVTVMATPAPPVPTTTYTIPAPACQQVQAYSVPIPQACAPAAALPMVMPSAPCAACAAVGTAYAVETTACADRVKIHLPHPFLELRIAHHERVLTKLHAK